MSKPTKKNRLRAGKVKCRRCKTCFLRKKGELFRICERCRVHCVRCDVELNRTTQDASNKKQYHCKVCVVEAARNTLYKKERKDYDLLRKYGITINEYERILVAQKGVCWICGREPKNVSLSVDHKHEPGENKRNPREKRSRVRGILCWHCNNAISKFSDNPSYLRNAANYLEKWPAQSVLNCTNTRM